MDQELERLAAYYRDWGPGLLAYFRPRQDSRHAAEDLLQETFAQAMRHLDRLQLSESPRAYLYGIARHLNAQAMRQARPWEPLDAIQPPPCDPGPEPESDPRIESMRAALRSMPDALREILELRLHHELSYVELAHVLGIPIGTVRSRLHQAVALLRKKTMRRHAADEASTPEISRKISKSTAQPP